jgi:hypothetical protein
MDKQSYILCGEIMLKIDTVQKKIKALIKALEKKRDEILGILGCQVHCYSHGEVETSNGKVAQFVFQIPLAEYLALWPDAAPELKTYDSDTYKCKRCFFQYPQIYCGANKEGTVQVWVAAQSKTINLPATKELRPVSAEPAEDPSCAQARYGERS